MNRRQFLCHTSAAAGTLSLPAFPYHLFAGTTKKLATDRILLGPERIELSRVAMGTGTNGVGGSSNQTRKLGKQGLADMLRAGYDQGLTFWDSADQYGTHPHVKLAKTGIPREKLTILSKTHATTEKEMKADLDRFRLELGTDYVDIMLLHCMTEASWPDRKKGAMAAISEAKEKGIVRTHGISQHHLGAMKTAAAHPWVEVDLARINPAGAVMDSDPATVLSVLKEMKKNGKGVIGMKIVGAGKLRGGIDKCLQFALAQDSIDCFTIGMESREEMEQVLAKVPAASMRG